MNSLSEITVIKRKVLKEVATLAWEDRLGEIDTLPKQLTKEGITNYRCCEYRERAILADRIKLALGATIDGEDEERLSSIAEEKIAQQETDNEQPLISVLAKACDRCPIEKMVVTNACRNCVAHNCRNVCPRDAITIVNQRAYINRERCVECGLCVKACRFSAILMIERPCTRACAVGALQPGANKITEIDHEKCVECGACIEACPFGAISERSELLSVIALLKDKGVSTQALVAPAVAGQFGPMVDWPRVVSGLKKLGFSGVVPVALGADVVGKAEGEELAERKQEGKILFNSCCPSFKNLIRQKFPSLAHAVSGTKSPMLVTAELVRQAAPTAKLVFIGPCLAKKGEAKHEGNGLIDAVLTFEELTAMLVSANINLAECEPAVSSEGEPMPSARGLNFAKAGGVLAAVTGTDRDEKTKAIAVAGLGNCQDLLAKIARGTEIYDFVEGMGCEGGCVGGPGTLVNTKAAVRALQKTTEKKKKGVA